MEYSDIVQAYISFAKNTKAVDFRLSFRKFKSLYLQKRCKLTGIPFTSGPLVVSSGSMGSSGLDRAITKIDSKLPLTDDNAIACVAAMRFFNRLEARHFKKVIKYKKKK